VLRELCLLLLLCRSQPIEAVIPHDVPQLVFNTRYYGEGDFLVVVCAAACVAD
jgi:hypothetical protein